MSTALSIKGKTQANDGVTSTINYVNPNATNAQLVSLATAMNNLTTNTVADITRIDKNSLTSAVTKLPRNAYLTAQGASTAITSVKASDVGQTFDEPLILDIHYEDQAGEYEEIAISKPAEHTSYYVNWYGRTGTGQEPVGALFIMRETGTEAAEYNIYIPEDSAYQAATITLTITAE